MSAASIQQDGSNTAATPLQGDSNDNNNSNSGVWIGIDFGTSNCACAVWDSAGGRAKLMRMKSARPTTNNNKLGRIIPSTVLFQSGKEQDDILYKNLFTIVGQAASEALEKSLVNDDGSDSNVSSAIVTSIKRVLGRTSSQLHEMDRDFIESLPFVLEFEKEQVLVKLVPLDGKRTRISIQPIQIAAILLRAIRLEAQHYLDTQGRKKRLGVPGGLGKIQNVVVGVPAHWSQSQRVVLKKGCQMAGVEGKVATLAESTAAAMAYGLNVTLKPKTILVFDMGGGTTDVTIVCKQGDEFRVAVTEGDNQLGGNDMDELFLKMVLKKLKLTVKDLATRERQSLLLSCRRSKEELCGDGTGTNTDSTTTILDKHCRVTVSMQEFNDAIQPLVERARQLVVERAMARFAKLHSKRKIDEVVLVGGATRVPLVRDMLRQVFKVELCCSLDAEGAVAQGLAIQAAILSNKVPKHELRSALMLDVLPHTIGVQLPNGDFVSILERDATLPARGYATFTLADVHQPGVTVEAMEQVEPEEFQPLGSFTFLLRKLTEVQLEKLGNQRMVDIGMTLETSGKLVVSIFDENDPEHLEKKRRYQQGKLEQNVTSNNLGYNEAATNSIDLSTKGQVPNSAEENVTMEQVMLMVACFVLFVLYIAVKLAFSGPPEESARIL